MEKRFGQDRRSVPERRKSKNRRHLNVPVIPDKRTGDARRLGENRRKYERRRDDVVVI